ncbi:hypothetical protein [Paenibacillus sp. WLX2291]|uniref:hypothetical protein n=1 Tax=Paenibacillus sp. WLX2291 TaxID=3296934 RepID=UPI00398412C7
MSTAKLIGKTVLGGGVGYLIGCMVGIWTPGFIAMLFPLAGSVYGVIWAARSQNRPAELPPSPGQPPLSQPQSSGRQRIQNQGSPQRHPLQEQYEQAARQRAVEHEQQRHAPFSPDRGGSASTAPGTAGQTQSSSAASAQPASTSGSNTALTGQPSAEVLPIFQPVLEYLSVLEDMIISEGQKNNLDNEIVEKACALFLRLQRVIPVLSDLNNDDINHTIKRLVMKDLNGVINPFLRLSGEAKTKNRRILLDGIKDVNNRVTQIVKTIEHKDLLELQSRAEILHQRYS